MDARVPADPVAGPGVVPVPCPWVLAATDAVPRVAAPLGLHVGPTACIPVKLQKDFKKPTTPEEIK